MMYTVAGVKGHDVCKQSVTQLSTCGQVLRLEAQVSRYKLASEKSEKMEDELKVEKRKLQREVNVSSPW